MASERKNKQNKQNRALKCKPNTNFSLRGGYSNVIRQIENYHGEILREGLIKVNSKSLAIKKQPKITQTLNKQTPASSSAASPAILELDEEENVDPVALHQMSHTQRQPTLQEIVDRRLPYGCKFNCVL